MKLIIAVAIIVVLASFTVAGADAKRGKKSHQVEQTTISASVYAVPDPSATDSIVRIQGCGMLNDRSAIAYISHGGAMEAYGIVVWYSANKDHSSGQACPGWINFPFLTSEVGIYSLTITQLVMGIETVQAAGSFTVSE